LDNKNWNTGVKSLSSKTCNSMDGWMFKLRELGYGISITIELLILLL